LAKNDRDLIDRIVTVL